MAFKIDYFQLTELLSGMECTIKRLIVYGAAIHFAGCLSTHLPWSINTHLNSRTPDVCRCECRGSGTFALPLD